MADQFDFSYGWCTGNLSRWVNFAEDHTNNLPDEPPMPFVWTYKGLRYGVCVAKCEVHTMVTDTITKKQSYTKTPIVPGFKMALFLLKMLRAANVPTQTLYGYDAGERIPVTTTAPAPVQAQGRCYQKKMKKRVHSRPVTIRRSCRDVRKPVIFCP